MSQEDSHEDLEKIQEEAARIDLYRYSRRRRAILGFLLGGFLAGATWLVLEMFDQKRNPCERLRNHLCAQDPGGLQCRMYDGVFRESVEDENSKMRSQIRAQCVTKIERIKEEDGVDVP